MPIFDPFMNQSVETEEEKREVLKRDTSSASLPRLNGRIVIDNPETEAEMQRNVQARVKPGEKISDLEVLGRAAGLPEKGESKPATQIKDEKGVKSFAINSGAAPVIFDPFAEKQKDPETRLTSWIEREVRNQALGTRWAAEGLAAPFTMLGDAANEAINLYTSTVNKLWGTNIPRLGSATEAVSGLLTDAGLPVEETAQERVLGSVARGAASVIPTAGAGLAAKAAGAAGPLVESFAATPTRQVVSGATSGLASGAVREAGGHPLAQVGAGLLGAAAPGVVPTRAVDAARGMASRVLRTAGEGVEGVRAQPYENSLVTRAAATKMDKMRSTGELGDVISSNRAGSSTLEKVIHGLKLDEAQRSGDPNIVAELRSLEHERATVVQNLNQMQNNASIGAYISKQIKGKGNSAELSKRVAETQVEIETARIAAVEEVEQALGMRGEGSAIDAIGQNLRDLAVKGRDTLKAKFAARWNAIDQKMVLPAEPLETQINKVFGNTEEFFTQLKNIPDSTLNRTLEGITKESPAGRILTPSGKPATPAQTFTEITVKQLKELNESINTDMRRARISQLGGLADNLSELKVGVDNVIANAVETGGAKGEAAGALKKWWSDYRTEYVPKYRKGTTFDILRRGKDMEYRVDPAQVGEKYFLPGVKTVQAAEDFKTTFGDNPAALDLVHQYAAEDLARTLRLHPEGITNEKVIKAWTAKRSDALKAYGLEGAFADLDEAIHAAGVATARQNKMDMAVFSKLANADPVMVAKKILSSGHTDKNMQDLLTSIRKSPEGFNGLKAAVGEVFETEMAASRKTLPDGTTLFDSKKAEGFMDSYRTILTQIYGPEGMKSFNHVTAALKKINIDIQKAGGIAQIAEKDLFERTMKTVMGASPLSFPLRVANAVSKMTYYPFKRSIANTMFEAMYNPEKAQQLYLLGQELKRSNRPAAQIMTDFARRQALFHTGMKAYYKKQAPEENKPRGEELEW